MSLTVIIWIVAAVIGVAVDYYLTVHAKVPSALATIIGIALVFVIAIVGTNLLVIG